MQKKMISLIAKIRRNPRLRKFFMPLMKNIREIQLKMYRNSTYARRIRELKDKYSNEMCFIVGNGPSLTIQDLERIQDKYSFGANMIYRLFDKTAWRPTFYVSVDKDAYKLIGAGLRTIDAKKLFYLLAAKKYIKQENIDNIYYMCLDTKFVDIPSENLQTYISEDISQGISDGKTVTFISIQLAIYMGFKMIYLLGVDHNYAQKVDREGKVSFEPGQKNYAEGIPDNGLGIQYIDATTEAYRQAHKYCEKHDVKIYNATRGGKLEIFERVDFDKLF